jgi:hypothetical protein
MEDNLMPLDPLTSITAREMFYKDRLKIESQYSGVHISSISRMFKIDERSVRYIAKKFGENPKRGIISEITSKKVIDYYKSKYDNNNGGNNEKASHQAVGVNN